MALIAVSSVFSQSTLSTELQKQPIMSIEDKKVVGQAPKNYPKWTWITTDHAAHLLKGAGYTIINTLQKK